VTNDEFDVADPPIQSTVTLLPTVTNSGLTDATPLTRINCRTVASLQSFLETEALQDNLLFALER
jgi:hypothetical protein